MGCPLESLTALGRASRAARRFLIHLIHNTFKTCNEEMTDHFVLKHRLKEAKETERVKEMELICKYQTYINKLNQKTFTNKKFKIKLK